MYCRPRWHQRLGTVLNDLRYKSIMVLKDTQEIKEIYKQDFLDSLEENYIWKIITPTISIYRTEGYFREEFTLLEDNEY